MKRYAPRPLERRFRLNISYGLPLAARQRLLLLFPYWRHRRISRFRLDSDTLRRIGGRRCLGRRCRSAGLAHVAKGVWYEPATDIRYYSLLNYEGGAMMKRITIELSEEAYQQLQAKRNYLVVRNQEYAARTGQPVEDVADLVHIASVTLEMALEDEAVKRQRV